MPIEIIRSHPAAVLRLAALDFDGTLSLVRSGWQRVMLEMMLDALAPVARDEPADRLAEQALAAIDRLTGQATLLQMAWLAEQVATRGGPALAPAVYKAQFAARVGVLIAARLGALGSSELAADRLLMPGARVLLDGLRTRGLTLALVSGSDQADVRAEAEALGIAHYFGARIYGPSPHAPGFTKRAAMEQLLGELGLTGGQLLAIGDGPAEIADAHALGGLTVGVAFDEARGAGADLPKRARLIAAGANLIIEDFRQADGWHTPTYTKPIVRLAGGPPQELERLDIRTRAPAPPDAQAVLLGRLAELAPHVDAVVVADQMPEAECGVVTARVRERLAALAVRHPATWFLADSRARIGEFRQVIAKPNLAECRRATGLSDEQAAGRALQRRTGRPVFVTLGERGMLVLDSAADEYVAGVAVPGPIDVVGAGDSALAAITAALCVGASLAEAALLGNLAAAVTIQQLGTTGTATPEQILALQHARVDPPSARSH